VDGMKRTREIKEEGLEEDDVRQEKAGVCTL
jgi:hypothetical protein